MRCRCRTHQSGRNESVVGETSRVNQKSRSSRVLAHPESAVPCACSGLSPDSCLRRGCQSNSCSSLSVSSSPSAHLSLLIHYHFLFSISRGLPRFLNHPRRRTLKSTGCWSQSSTYRLVWASTQASAPCGLDSARVTCRSRSRSLSATLIFPIFTDCVAAFPT